MVSGPVSRSIVEAWDRKHNKDKSIENVGLKENE